MGFSRQENWSGLPCPSPGDLPDPGTEHGSPSLQADFFFFFYHLSHWGSQTTLQIHMVPYADGNHSAHLVLIVEDKSEIKVQIHKASLKPLGGPSHAFL